MYWKLIAIHNDAEIFTARSTDVDDLYVDVRHFKESITYKKLKEEELEKNVF